MEMSIKSEFDATWYVSQLKIRYLLALCPVISYIFYTGYSCIDKCEIKTK